MSGMYKRRIRKGVEWSTEMQDQNTDLTQSTNQQLLIFHEAETQRRSTASLHPFQAGVEWREEFSTLLYTLPAACVFAIHRFYFFPPTTTTVHSSSVFVLDLGMVLLTIYSSRYTTHWHGSSSIVIVVGYIRIPTLSRTEPIYGNGSTTAQDCLLLIQ